MAVSAGVACAVQHVEAATGLKHSEKGRALVGALGRGWGLLGILGDDRQGGTPPDVPPSRRTKGGATKGGWGALVHGTKGVGCLGGSTKGVCGVPWWQHQGGVWGALVASTQGVVGVLASLPTPFWHA